MKHRVIGLIVTIVLVIGLATGQNAKAGSSSKAGHDATLTAIKPITPKSATSAPHKSGVVVPNASKQTGNSSAELDQLEKKKIVASSQKRDGAGTPKVAPVKPAKSASGSGLNEPYHKPPTPKN